MKNGDWISKGGDGDDRPGRDWLGKMRYTLWALMKAAAVVLSMRVSGPGSWPHPGGGSRGDRPPQTSNGTIKNRRESDGPGGRADAAASTPTTAAEARRAWRRYDQLKDDYLAASRWASDLDGDVAVGPPTPPPFPRPAAPPPAFLNTRLEDRDEWAARLVDETNRDINNNWHLSRSEILRRIEDATREAEDGA